jgi:hypothetical protein
VVVEIIGEQRQADQLQHVACLLALSKDGFLFAKPIQSVLKPLLHDQPGRETRIRGSLARHSSENLLIEAVHGPQELGIVLP